MDRLTLNVAGLLQEASGISRRLEIDGFFPDWDEISLVTPIRGAVELARAASSLEAIFPQQSNCRAVGA